MEKKRVIQHQLGQDRRVRFNTNVVEYTSYANTKTIPTKDSGNSPSEDVLAQCCLAMEESLNSVYPLEIRVVKSGTFKKLMDYAISRGVFINQCKVPRCVSFTPIMELLDSRVYQHILACLCLIGLLNAVSEVRRRFLRF
ncbi:hypothetical protein CsSME_00047841 [Camellia sinensis var. sinensis]